MPARADSMPKQFRRLLCPDCGISFQATGPASKRCSSCQAAKKKAYDHAYDLSLRERRSACIDCSAPFPDGVHAAKKRCEVCAKLEARAQRAKFQKDNRALGPVYRRRHYVKHRDKILERRNSPKGREQAARIIRERRRRDPGYRLHCNISRVVALSLDGAKGGRGWEALVGYTREQLTAHLERQFTKSMTWENMGGETGWQVDHILPRALFSFSSPDDPDFKACWALTNLRPLWRDENASKREKRLHLI